MSDMKMTDIKVSDISVSDTTSTMSAAESKTSRTMYVHNSSWTMRHLRITTANKSNVLYEVDYHFRTPNLVVKRPGSGDKVGTIAYRFPSNNMRVEVNKQSIDVTTKTWKGNAYQYLSPNLGEMEWKGDFKQVLVDSKGLALARADMACMSVKKMGTIEPTEELEAMGQDIVEEVLMTGLALLMRYWCNPATSNGMGALVAATS